MPGVEIPGFLKKPGIWLSVIFSNYSAATRVTPTSCPPSTLRLCNSMPCSLVGCILVPGSTTAFNLTPFRVQPFRRKLLTCKPFRRKLFKVTPWTTSAALADPEKAKESAAVARAIVNTLFFTVKILNCVFKTLPICCNV